MKEGDFDALRRPEAERFSGGQFRFAIESLDDARRDRAPSPEPVEDQVPMTPQAPGDLLHRADPAAQGAGAPGIEELHGPLGARVLAEPLEVLAEQMSPDALEVVLQDLLEPDLLMLREVLWSLEQAPTSLRQDWLGAVSAQLGDFGPPDLIKCHVDVPHDVEAVEHMEGGRNLFGDQVEILSPHVAADEADARTPLSSERGEEAPQALLGQLLGHPEQPLRFVDLIDEREVGVAAAPLDLIDTDGLDAREIPMGEAPFDRVFYGAKHVVPGRVECVGGLFPREPLFV